MNDIIEMSKEEKQLTIMALKQMRMDVNKQILKLVQSGVKLEAQEASLKKIDVLIKKLEGE